MISTTRFSLSGLLPLALAFFLCSAPARAAEPSPTLQGAFEALAQAHGVELLWAPAWDFQISPADWRSLAHDLSTALEPDFGRSAERLLSRFNEFLSGPDGALALERGASPLGGCFWSESKEPFFVALPAQDQPECERVARQLQAQKAVRKEP